MGEKIMARMYKIGWAFRDAIKLGSRSRHIVTTNEFCLALAKYNHYWTLEQCNEYILRYQSNFLEIDAVKENKTWALRNMGYVM